MYRNTAALQMRRWDTKLVMESAQIDVLSDFTGINPGTKKAIPNAVIVQFDLKGKRTGVMALLKKLSGSGVTGRTVLIGNEVDQDTREQVIYANDLRQAVATEQYGVDANDKEPWGLLPQVQPQLSDWLKEIDGKYAREALWEKYSVNLTVAPHSLTKVYNENILCKNVVLTHGSGADQADYQGSASAAAYLEDIGDALAASGSTAASSWDVRFLNRMQYYAQVVKKIQPLSNGKYVVLVPSAQATILKDPQAATSIPGLFINSQTLDLAVVGKNQYLGDFGALMLFEDPRNPLVKLSGSDGSWALTTYYKGAGDDDDRTAATGDLYDIGFLLGENAAIKGQYETPHFEDELQDYNKIKGIGIACGFAYQRSVWLNDNASETRSKTINQGSMALLAYHQALSA